MTLPAGSSAGSNPASRSLFETAREHTPRPTPGPWKVSAQAANGHFILKIDTGKAEDNLAFFPLEPGQIDNVAPEILHRTARGAELELTKSDELLQPLASVKGVLVSGDVKRL